MVKYCAVRVGRGVMIWFTFTSSLVLFISIAASGRTLRVQTVDPCPHLEARGKRKLIEMGEIGKPHLCCGCPAGFRLLLSCTPMRFNTTKCESCPKGKYIADDSHKKRLCEVDTRPTTTTPTVTTKAAQTTINRLPPETTKIVITAEVTASQDLPMKKGKMQNLIEAFSARMTTSEAYPKDPKYFSPVLEVLIICLVAFSSTVIVGITWHYRKRLKTMKRNHGNTDQKPATNKNESIALLTQEPRINEEQTRTSELQHCSNKHTRNHSDDLRVDIQKAKGQLEYEESSYSGRPSENQNDIGSAKVLVPGEIEHISTPVPPVDEDEEAWGSEGGSISEPSCSAIYQLRKETDPIVLMKEFFATMTVSHSDVILHDSDVAQFGRSFGLGEQRLKEIRRNHNTTSESLFQTFMQIYNERGRSLQPSDIVSYFKSTRQTLLAQQLEETLMRHLGHKNVFETKL